jgi:GNAT superfamily N-acetyltransferase
VTEATYREGGPELLDEIGELWSQLNRHHLERSGPFRAQYEGKVFATRREEMLSKAGGGELRVFLASVPNEIGPVGYCIGLFVHGIGEIESIFVRPDHRGQGIGAAALEFAATLCRALGIRAMHLEADYFNERAHLFYRRMHFRDHTRHLMTRWLEEDN